MHPETLEEMLEKLEVVVNERREEENAAAAEIEERTRSCSNTRNADCWRYWSEWTAEHHGCR